MPLTGPVAVRSFLLRGLLAGLIAGLAAFAVGYLVGEPPLSAAISLEEAAGASGGHSHGAEASTATGTAHTHGEGALVPRSLQSTLGLATGTLVAGVSLGGLLGVLTALALGRLAGGTRSTSLLLAAVGFVAVQLVPFLVYPPNPPGVGDAASIGLRTALYFVLVAIAVLAAVAALLTAVSLRPHWGGWYAGIAAVAGFLLVISVVAALLPGYDEVPDGYPASLLHRFRMAGLLTQATLWAVLGVALAELTSRLVAPTSADERLTARAGSEA